MESAACEVGFSCTWDTKLSKHCVLFFEYQLWLHTVALISFVWCRYDAIVVGLGGHGSASLYHLAKLGLKVWSCMLIAMLQLLSMTVIVLACKKWPNSYSCIEQLLFLHFKIMPIVQEARLQNILIVLQHLWSKLISVLKICKALKLWGQVWAYDVCGFWLGLSSDARWTAIFARKGKRWQSFCRCLALSSTT